MTGGCMCGAARYETTGDTSRAINCHCESCRRHTGAPMATLVVFKAEQVTFSGDDRAIYVSAPGVVRGFCGVCGTPLTWETEHIDLGQVCAIHISTFDDPDAITPIAHSFYGEKISWFDTADNLPRHEGFVANSPVIRHGPADMDTSG